LLKPLLFDRGASSGGSLAFLFLLRCRFCDTKLLHEYSPSKNIQKQKSKLF
jgi:hypothetical protein